MRFGWIRVGEDDQSGADDGARVERPHPAVKRGKQARIDNSGYNFAFPPPRRNKTYFVRSKPSTRKAARLHPNCMVRPCFLVIDREFAGSISTRKLVIETAKFNVLTAYSSLEAIATLKAYPALNGAVVDGNMPHMPCGELIASLKQIKPGLPVVAVSAPGATPCQGADYHLESFDPRKLLGILQSLEPQQTAAIEQRNEELSRDQK